MGLSCPSLPVFLASPSITGLVPLLKLAHLGPAPQLLRTLLYSSFNRTGGSLFVHGKPGFKRAQIHTEHFII